MTRRTIWTNWASWASWAIWTLATFATVASVALFAGCAKDESAQPVSPAKVQRAEERGGVKAPTPKAEEPKAEEPKAEEPKAEEPKAEEPKVEEPKAEEPKVEEPKVEEPKVEEPKVEEPKVEEPKAENAAPAAPAQPGTAWFGTRNSGLIALEDGKFTTLIPDLKSVRDIAVAADGTLYVASIGAIHKLEKGGKPQQIGDFRKPGSVDHIAVSPDGKLYAISFQGVSSWDGRDWTTEEKTKLGSDVTLLNDIAVDSKGDLWVVSSNALHVREGDAWRVVDTSAADKQKLFFKDLAASPTGPIFATHSGGVLKIDGGVASVVPLGSGFFSINGLSLGGGDTVHVASLGAIVVAPPTGAVREYSAKAGSFKAKSVNAIAADASGRTWAATDNGMVIVAPDGTVTEWLPGSVRELTDSVEALLVSANGPSLPEVGEQAKGAIQGKVIRSGEGLAGIEVEVCNRPSMMFRKSPCDDAPFHASVKTDAEGNFAFDGVPLGTYRFALKPDEKWTITLSDCCSTMQEGKSFDVGSIDLTK